MRRFVLAIGLGIAIAGGCTPFDAAEQPPGTAEGGPEAGSDGQTTDGAATLDSGAKDGGSVTAPSACPLTCTGHPASQCRQDDCMGNSTTTCPVGTADSKNGVCSTTTTGAAPAGCHISKGLDLLVDRTFVELGFTLSGATSFPANAGIGIAEIRSQPEDNHLVGLGLENGTLTLCELAGLNVLRCASPVPFVDITKPIHIFGVASKQNPPNATMTLTIGCSASASATLVLERPFTGTMVRGSVGCRLGPAATTCSTSFEDLVLVARPE